jgi:hypothetical protein
MYSNFCLSFKPYYTVDAPNIHFVKEIKNENVIGFVSLFLVILHNKYFFKHCRLFFEDRYIYILRNYVHVVNFMLGGQIKMPLG